MPGCPRRGGTRKFACLVLGLHPSPATFPCPGLTASRAAGDAQELHAQRREAFSDHLAAGRRPPAGTKQPLLRPPAPRGLSLRGASPEGHRPARLPARPPPPALLVPGSGIEVGSGSTRGRGAEAPAVRRFSVGVRGVPPPAAGTAHPGRAASTSPAAAASGPRSRWGSGWGWGWGAHADASLLRGPGRPHPSVRGLSARPALRARGSIRLPARACAPADRTPAPASPVRSCPMVRLPWPRATWFAKCLEAAARCPSRPCLAREPERRSWAFLGGVPSFLGRAVRQVVLPGSSAERILHPRAKGEIRTFLGGGKLGEVGAAGRP